MGAAVAAVLALIAAIVWWQPFGGSPADTLRIAMLPIEEEDGVDPLYAIGFGEELRLELSCQEGVEVTGSDSARQLLESGLTPADIGKRLGVDYVWRGTLESGVDRVTLIAELIQVAEGEVVWSQSLASAPESGPTIPLRTARAVMDAVGRPLSAVIERQSLRSEDFRLFVVAKGMLRARDRSQTPTARAILTSLTEANPEFGAGWALLAHATAIDFSEEDTYPLETRLTDARGFIERGLELAPDSPDALAIAGFLAQTPE